MTSTMNDDTTIEIYRKVKEISLIGRYFAKFMSSLASLFFSFNDRILKKGGIFATISNENSTPSTSAEPTKNKQEICQQRSSILKPNFPQISKSIGLIGETVRALAFLSSFAGVYRYLR